MTTVEFQTTLNADRTISVPAAVAEKIPAGQPIRVLILIDNGDPDREWEQLAATEFGQGYADSDAIYDQLSVR